MNRAIPQIKLRSNEKFILQLPFCRLQVELQDGKLISTEYVPNKTTLKPPVSPLARSVANKIQRYLAHPQTDLDVPIKPAGTPFQQAVWQQLCKIPSGVTRTYGDIAAQLNTSARAVGNACRANPLPLVVPCHRVVAVNGLGGFSGQTKGWMLDIKRQLLRHEGLEIS